MHNLPRILANVLRSSENVIKVVNSNNVFHFVEYGGSNRTTSEILEEI